MKKEPILTRIEQAVADNIKSMTVATGYYYDWGSVNERDVRNQTYPSAEIAISGEECQDETDGAWNGVYNQHATMIIRVRVSLDQEEEAPFYEINNRMNRALDDLKRLMGIKYTMSDACETLMYRGMVRIPERSNDILRPSYMDTSWLIQYIQVRTDPSKYN